MKIQINAEADGNEVINDFVIPKVKESGIVVNSGDVKVQVFSEKAGKFIDYKPEHVKFIFARS